MKEGGAPRGSRALREDLASLARPGENKKKKGISDKSQGHREKGPSVKIRKSKARNTQRYLQKTKTFFERKRKRGLGIGERPKGPNLTWNVKKN